MRSIFKRSFMIEGVTAGGSKKRRAVKLTGETKVFEEGSMGEAPGGGSLSTYKELCALATDMGQPDLIYKFMDLANHQASLNSSRGAAFGYILLPPQASAGKGHAIQWKFSPESVNAQAFLIATVISSARISWPIQGSSCPTCTCVRLV